MLPDGEEGELVFTSLTKQAMPVIRYRTRDLTRLLPGTAYPAFRRMEKVTGRTDDMMIVRGVNVFPTQIEEQILAVEGLAPHYLCVLTRPGNLDELDRPGRGAPSDAARTAEALGAALARADQAADRRDRPGRGAGAARARALARQGEADQRPALEPHPSRARRGRSRAAPTPCPVNSGSRFSRNAATPSLPSPMRV